MTRIEAKYLTKVYKNGAYGLKNCSLTVLDGEFLVIVGASGSGKSTLLKVLAGILELSSGELYFDGILSENIPAGKRDVSMVFQEYVLYPHMTVFDNLATPLRQAGEDERSIYNRVMGALRIFGLEITADVKPKNLSGGEQQRVALCKALLKRSRLVLLDEPMSNVDEKSRAEYCNTLKKMKRMLPDSTFIYVTHNTKEAMFLADRIAVMRDGAILQIAKKDLILNYPDDPGVTEILGGGSPPSLSMTELILDGELNENKLTFASGSADLDSEYLSRLLRRPTYVGVGIEVERLSKIQLKSSVPLVFEVVENNNDHLILTIDKKSFVLARKTDLLPGERIRLYYKIQDIVLYEGNERLTCHYPLHRRIEINVIDADRGIIKLLGKRIRLGISIPSYAKFVEISELGFRLSHKKTKYSIPVVGCLDEEFINNKKLSYIEINGADSYLSLLSGEEICCFDKKRVWLNIIPEGLIVK